MSEQVSVIIPAGVPCKGCGDKIMSQEDKPVVFWCEDHDTDHIWHKDCLPPDLTQLLEEYTIRETSRWN